MSLTAGGGLGRHDDWNTVKIGCVVGRVVFFVFFASEVGVRGVAKIADYTSVPSVRRYPS